MNKFIVTLSTLMFTISAHAQIIQQADGMYVSPYCAVNDSEFSSIPGVDSYQNYIDGAAFRKSDGGLLAVPIERGIGCKVTIREEGKKLFAHIIARRVSVEPLVMDNEKILLVMPKSRIDLWEHDVDLSTIDSVEFLRDDVPLNMNVIVGVVRTKP